MIKRSMIILFSIITLCLVFLNSGIKTFSETNESYTVADRETGEILFEKNGNIRRSVASLTKILTAITIIENENLNKTCYISKKCEFVDGSKVYLKEGEQFTVIDLLYGLMLRSGNDCAIALSENFSGGSENLINKMNEFAVCCGAKNSSFKNPHGLEEEGHYSTSNDIALISSKAMKKPVYRKIVSSKNYTAKEITTGRVLYLKNKNKMLFSNEFCIGGKTGFTKVSGRCLQTAFKNEDREIVCVVLGYGDTYGLTERLFRKVFDKNVKFSKPELNQLIFFAKIYNIDR